MASYPESGGILLVGGMINAGGALGVVGDVWAWSGGDYSWKKLSMQEEPRFPFGCPLVFDSTAGATLMFVITSSIENARRQVYSLDQALGKWLLLQTANDGPIQMGPMATYDEQAGRSLFFGGSVAPWNETWSFASEARTWTNLKPTVSPPRRDRACMVYDPQTAKVILFGGVGERGLLNDTWAYDPRSNTWSDLNPPGPLPTPRAGASMVYDPASDRILLVGGTESRLYPPARGGTYDGVMGDIWSYDAVANTWTELAAEGPPPRAFAALAYDPSTKGLVLFGGYGADGPLGDTWVFGR